MAKLLVKGFFLISVAPRGSAAFSASVSLISWLSLYIVQLIVDRGSHSPKALDLLFQVWAYQHTFRDTCPLALGPQSEQKVEHLPKFGFPPLSAISLNESGAIGGTSETDGPVSTGILVVWKVVAA